MGEGVHQPSIHVMPVGRREETRGPRHGREAHVPHGWGAGVSPSPAFPLTGRSPRGQGTADGRLWAPWPGQVGGQGELEPEPPSPSRTGGAPGQAPEAWLPSPLQDAEGASQGRRHSGWDHSGGHVTSHGCGAGGTGSGSGLWGAAFSRALARRSECTLVSVPVLQGADPRGRLTTASD